MAREPSNPKAYAEAKAAADGDTVELISGAEAAPDMTLWHEGQWLTVRYRSPAGEAVRLDFEVAEPGETAFRFADPGTELYRRIPAEVRHG